VHVAVLSDIHSNPFALAAVLRDVQRAGVAEVWLAGDTFGYYPWAAETFALVNETRPLAILGNHDRWVLDATSAPSDLVGEIARRNAGELPPRAHDWLASLRPALRLERSGLAITVVHGTPEDPLDGRYYPTDNGAHGWLPGPGEILIMGQTHYPLLRGNAARGLLLNPGSVGQPRDGDPMPSWAIVDLGRGEASLRRTLYDNLAVMERLRTLGWDDRVTAALDKR
jgi:predicted phosphodiesterase